MIISNLFKNPANRPNMNQSSFFFKSKTKAGVKYSMAYKLKTQNPKIHTSAED